MIVMNDVFFYFSEELADVERLKRIFRGYFSDHQCFSAIEHDELQAIVEERAQACAAKYREKLRRLHLSHTDYYLDSLHRLSTEENPLSEQLSTSTTVITRTTLFNTTNDCPDRNANDHRIMSISVV